jgi:cytochrome o ubiquinol oxidase operon protein cyoD
MSTLRTYSIGFALSILLTLFAFWVVPGLPAVLIYPALIFLALAQLLVQLICFLHLGSGAQSRWNLAALAFTIIIVGILVAGSLWIMYNLSHMMVPPPSDANFLPGGITPQHSLD